MRILVIGGIQFMGRGIVERLARRGHDVTVLHRRDHHDLGDEIGNLKADRGDHQAMKQLLGDGQFDVIYDIAYDWEKGTTADDVLVAARSGGSKLQRFVFMSSVAAYGGGLDHRERDPLATDHPFDYIRHKASAESALFGLASESGFPVTTFRPPFVHGPRQPLYREQFFWDRMLDGRPIILPAEGEQLMQWAFVEDVADACVRAIEVPEAAGEAFNVAHVSPISQRDFVEALARTAGVEPEMVPIAREEIHAAGGDPFAGNLYFGEYLDIPPITSVIEKAPQILGIEPTPFDEALAAGFDWYRRQPRRTVDYGFEDRLLAGR
jgi:2'-hydroxyisoflavone reductase